MKTPFQSLFIAALAAPTVLAHTVWSVLYVDGVSQGDGAALRMRMDPKTATFPVEDYSSDAMACNVDGAKGVNYVSSVKDGSTLTFEMRSWPDDPSKMSLDRPHYGPCAVYLKKVKSAISDKGAGDGWFKLMDDGYHADTDKWCTDKLIDNKGRLSVELPKGLEGGYYLARPEVVALHNASEGAAQFYTGCAQIFLESTGDLVPESTVAIPGPEYVSAGQSSVHFNIYVGKNAEYQVPGPAVANFTHASASVLSSTSQKTQDEGLVPAGCVAQNANWCAKEVASYSDEQGCWDANTDCWAQAKVCWAEAPPTGGKMCQAWSDHCTAISDACTAKNFNGPPNKGEVITPKRETIDIGLVIKPVGGGNVDDEAAPPASASPTAVPSDTRAPALASDAYEPTSSASASASASPIPSSSPSEAPTTTSAAPSFKQTPTFSSSVSLLSFVGGVYDVPTPSPSASKGKVVPSEYAAAPVPAPTAKAEVDAKEGEAGNGGKVVTDWRVEVVTETVYVTVGVGRQGRW